MKKIFPKSGVGYIWLDTWLELLSGYTVIIYDNLINFNKKALYKNTQIFKKDLFFIEICDQDMMFKYMIVNIDIKYFLALSVAFMFYAGNIWVLNQLIELSFYFAVFIALFLSFIFNYFLYKKFVFI